MTTEPKRTNKKRLKTMDTDAIDLHLSNILEQHQLINNLLKGYSKASIDKWFCQQASDELFNKYCYASKHPQSYGSLFERRFAHKNKLTKVPAKKNQGDLTNKDLYIEYKVSIMDENKPGINIVQIRPDHNIDYHVIQIIDARNYSAGIKLFSTLCLDKNQMRNECGLAGNHAAHGNKDTATELRIDLEFDSPAFNRFIQEYQFKESILLPKPKAIPPAPTSSSNFSMIYQQATL